MRKRAINLVLLTTVLVGGQVVDILPASTTVVAQAAIDKTGTVTASVLNVRQKASIKLNTVQDMDMLVLNMFH